MDNIHTVYYSSVQAKGSAILRLKEAEIKQPLLLKQRLIELTGTELTELKIQVDVPFEVVPTIIPEEQARVLLGNVWNVYSTVKQSLIPKDIIEDTTSWATKYNLAKRFLEEKDVEAENKLTYLLTTEEKQGKQVNKTLKSLAEKIISKYNSYIEVEMQLNGILRNFNKAFSATNVASQKEKLTAETIAQLRKLAQV